MQAFRHHDSLIHFDFERADPAKPTLVFVNSLGTDFRIWDQVRSALTGHYSLVFHDKRGHGLSTLGTAAHKIETYAEDVAALIEHLGFTNVVMVGLSVGGLIAQALYHARPELVSKLVISNSAVRLGSHDSWSQRIAAVTAGGTASIADAIMKVWYSPAFHIAHPNQVAMSHTMLTRTDRDGYIACCEALRDCDYTPQAAHIKVPTLFVGGDLDGSTPPDLVEASSKLMPSAKFHLLARCAHIPSVEQPTEFVRVLSNFASA